MLRRVAAILVMLEAAALVTVAGIYVVRAATGEAPADAAVAIALLALLPGVALVFAAQALWRGARWPRGLVITWQLLQTAAGALLVQWSPAAGAAVIAVGLAAAAAVLRDASDTARVAGTDAEPGPASDPRDAA